MKRLKRFARAMWHKLKTRVEKGQTNEEIQKRWSKLALLGGSIMLMTLFMLVRG